MVLTSSSYSNNQEMPAKYAYRGGATGGMNISPQFSWKDAPTDTKSFVLAMVDHHPVARNWVHWIVVNISSECNSINEGASNSNNLPLGSLELVNTYGTRGYGGPYPPIGSGKHNYDTTIYALGVDKVELSGRITENELLKKIEPHILSKALLRGLFER